MDLFKLLFVKMFFLSLMFFMNLVNDILQIYLMLSNNDNSKNLHDLPFTSAHLQLPSGLSTSSFPYHTIHITLNGSFTLSKTL